MLCYQVRHTHVALALEFRRLRIQHEDIGLFTKALWALILSTFRPVVHMYVYTEARTINGGFLLHLNAKHLLTHFGNVGPCDHLKSGRFYKRKGRAPRSGRPYETCDTGNPEASIGFASCRKCRIDVEITACFCRLLSE